MRKFFSSLVILFVFGSVAGAQVSEYGSFGGFSGGSQDFERGYRFIVEAGGAIETGDAVPGAFLSATCGYDFSRHFFIGGGVGALYLSDDKYYGAQAFVDARFSFAPAFVTPYVGVKLGANIPVHDDDGFEMNIPYAAVSLGARRPIGAVALSLSLDYAPLAGWYYSDAELDKKDDPFGVVLLKIGIEW